MVPEWIAALCMVFMFCFGILLGGALFGTTPFWFGVRSGLSLGRWKPNVYDHGNYISFRSKDPNAVIVQMNLNGQPAGWIEFNAVGLKRLIDTATAYLNSVHSFGVSTSAPPSTEKNLH